MGNDGRIPAEKLIKAAELWDGARRIHWRNMDIPIRRVITMEEAMELPMQIFNDCVGHDGIPAPEFFDFAARVRIVSSYANVELPDDSEQMYRILYYTDLYETVVGAVNKSQIDAIVNVAKMYLEGAIR